MRGSLQPLGDIGQGHCEGLHSRERILKVQYVGVPINPSKLHDLCKGQNGGLKTKN